MTKFPPVCLQFNRFDPEDGKITERDFAEILLVYAGYNEPKKIKMLKRVRRVFKEEQQVSRSLLQEILAGRTTHCPGQMSELDKSPV